VIDFSNSNFNKGKQKPSNSDSIKSQFHSYNNNVSYSNTGSAVPPKPEFSENNISLNSHYKTTTIIEKKKPHLKLNEKLIEETNQKFSEYNAKQLSSSNKTSTVSPKFLSKNSKAASTKNSGKNYSKELGLDGFYNTKQLSNLQENEKTFNPGFNEKVYPLIGNDDYRLYKNYSEVPKNVLNNNFNSNNTNQFTSKVHTKNSLSHISTIGNNVLKFPESVKNKKIINSNSLSKNNSKPIKMVQNNHFNINLNLNLINAEGKLQNYGIKKILNNPAQPNSTKNTNNTFNKDTVKLEPSREKGDDYSLSKNQGKIISTTFKINEKTITPKQKKVNLFKN
jgi:hypothetical protein